MITVRTNEVDADTCEAVELLARAVRALSVDAVTADLDPAALRAAAVRIDALRSTLPSSSRVGALRDPVALPVEAWRAGHPIGIARYNPFGIPLEIHVSEDGSRVWAELIADGTHEGPPGCVHGGIAAWLMDVMLGVVVQVNQQGALTGRLEVDYVAPTPLATPLLLEAHLVATADRRSDVEGRISVAGTVTVHAVGRFVVPKE